jgi:hypothetical protein
LGIEKTEWGILPTGLNSLDPIMDSAGAGFCRNVQASSVTLAEATAMNGLAEDKKMHSMYANLWVKNAWFCDSSKKFYWFIKYPLTQSNLL